MSGPQAGRLTRDLKSHLRAIQTSERGIFAYCEGVVGDRYFYGEVLARSATASLWGYHVYAASEIEGFGGKRGIKDLIKTLKRKNLVSFEWHGKKKKVLFFMDKDVDCIRRKKMRSKNIFYTRTYDIEGDIFSFTNLGRAIAVACGVDVASVPASYRNGEEVLETRAVAWREWLALCVYSSIYKTNCGCGYSRASLIHSRDNSRLDTNAEQNFWSQLQVHSGVDSNTFSARKRKVLKIIDNLIERKNLRSIFKGKWLPAILEEEIRKHLSAKRFSANGLQAKILAAALARVDFENGHPASLAKNIEEAIRQS